VTARRTLVARYRPLPTPPPDHLPFLVYGTLRPGCGNDGLWRGRAIAIGRVTVPGYRLVDRGAFPYAITASFDDAVVAEVLMAPADTYPALLAEMDWLEGVAHGHYARIRAAALTGADQASRTLAELGKRKVIGSAVVGWLYVAGSGVNVKNLPAVPGNDWAAR